MEQFDFDFFVIGGGSAGVRASRVAASLGARVALAEERYFGGTCVNVGCVPKKLFSYAAHFRDDFQDSRGFGWEVGTPSFDWTTLKNNKDKEISRLETIYRRILESNKVTIFDHRATLTGPHGVAVGNTAVSARHILLAVGGWPWKPAFEGEELAMTSNDIFTMDTLPRSMLVLGGGYIAVEFATIFARLGCEVTLVHRGDLLLKGFDGEVRQFLTQALAPQMNLLLGATVNKIMKYNNVLDVFLDNGAKVRADVVLAATGRRPATANLGLEHVRVCTNPDGAIRVNDSFQTDEPSIYAVGDVIDRVALTPVALAEGQIVARSLFGGAGADMSYDNIPSAVFSHPGVAVVGLSEEQARARYPEVDIYSARVKQLKHTLSGRQELSLLKLVVDGTTDRVLGVHMVGPDAGELIQGFAVALNCGATKADFDRTIGIHPTLAEEFVTMRTKRKDHSD